MTESTRDDANRHSIVETVKRQVVRQFSAALVGGRRHREYAIELGLSPTAVFEGYDAVDNAHFERGAQAVRADAEEARGRHGLPHRFFLASNRFVQKKNLFRLLSAYARYRMSAGCHAWKLVLLGDGELRPKLETHRRELGLEEHVLMPGFKQYDELPAWYGLASAFVHASTVEQWGLVVNEAMASGLPVLVSNRCGCAPDLVKEAVNGFTFDPYDIDELAGLMYRMAHEGVARTSMSRASQHIIKHWGPERFADGLSRAVEMAWQGPAPKGRLFDRMLLRSLMYRKPAPF